jgi:hypothetical protein
MSSTYTPFPSLLCVACAGAPRLYDLIKLSPKAEQAGLRPAFFFGLGNTLVANDLEQARTTAAKPRRTCLTLSLPDTNDALWRAAWTWHSLSEPPHLTTGRALLTGALHVVRVHIHCGVSIYTHMHASVRRALCVELWPRARTGNVLYRTGLCVVWRCLASALQSTPFAPYIALGLPHSCGNTLIHSQVAIVVALCVCAVGSPHRVRQ